jgi:hypothetical protein
MQCEAYVSDREPRRGCAGGRASNPLASPLHRYVMLPEGSRIMMRQRALRLLRTHTVPGDDIYHFCRLL